MFNPFLALAAIVPLALLALAVTAWKRLPPGPDAVIVTGIVATLLVTSAALASRADGVTTWSVGLASMSLAGLCLLAMSGRRARRR